MKKVFFTLAGISLISMVATSCKKEGRCRCYTDVVGVTYIVNSITTKKECKKESAKQFNGEYCKWE